MVHQQQVQYILSIPLLAGTVKMFMLNVYILAQVFIFPTSSSEFKNWATYIDNCLFKSALQINKNNFKIITMITYSKHLKRYSSKLYNLQKMEFSYPSVIVKSILGTTNCCPSFTSVETVYRKPFYWKFKPDPRIKMKVTFMKVQLVRENLYFKTFANREYESVHAASDSIPSRHKDIFWTGKTSTFSIYSVGKYLNITLRCFPSAYTKLSFIYTVVDNSSLSILYWRRRLVDSQSSFPTHYMYHTIVDQEIHSKSFHIMLNKLLRVKLKFINQDFIWRKIELYDGPDDQTKLIKQTGSQKILSTFQCYLKVNTKNSHKSTSGITILSVKQKIMHNITINRSLDFSFNMCKHKEPQHCIVQFNANNIYLNMSIINMTYNGPNTYGCAFGGLTYHGVNAKVRNTPLCDSYTQNPSRSSCDKVPMNYVSTDFDLLIIIYGYSPYNKDMEINMKISLTPCRGIMCLFDDACKYLKFL